MARQPVNVVKLGPGYKNKLDPGLQEVHEGKSLAVQVRQLVGQGLQIRVGKSGQKPSGHVDLHLFIVYKKYPFTQ